MLNHSVDFYKNLFGAELVSGVKLDEDFWGEDDKVTTLENEMLETSFY
jgi:hypothetical protein